MRLAAGRARTSPTARTSTPARPGPRCARTWSATSSPVKARWRRTGRSGWGCVSPRAAAELAQPAELDAFRGFLREQRPLRLHDQRLPVRDVPRDAREGGGVSARLARRRAPLVQRSPRRAPRRAPARRARARGQGQHGARRLQGARPRRGRRRADRGADRPSRGGAPPAARAHRQDGVARARARAVLPPRDGGRDGALLRGPPVRGAGGGRVRRA